LTDDGVDGENERDEDYSGRKAESVYVEIRFPHGVVEAVMDTGAKSFWVDKQWFLENGGRPDDSNGPVAIGADGKSLDVVGNGILPRFEMWGCKFDNIEVRVMDHLPSTILVGVTFWLKHDLKLDLGNMCGTIRVDGAEYKAKFSL
jgi:hypothetical protein